MLHLFVPVLATLTVGQTLHMVMVTGPRGYSRTREGAEQQHRSVVHRAALRSREARQNRTLTGEKLETHKTKSIQKRDLTTQNPEDAKGNLR